MLKSDLCYASFTFCDLLQLNISDLGCLPHKTEQPNVVRVVKFSDLKRDVIRFEEQIIYPCYVPIPFVKGGDVTKMNISNVRFTQFLRVYELKFSNPFTHRMRMKKKLVRRNKFHHQRKCKSYDRKIKKTTKCTCNSLSFISGLEM